MRTIKKTYIVAALALAITSAGLLGVTRIQAQEVDPHTSLIQKIATKFGLKIEDVQGVFSEHKTEMQNQMMARFEAKLTQLVTDGKITEAQKQLIINKHKEMQTAMQNKTPEERKTEMKNKKAELETWAKQNGIDLQYIMGFGFKGGHMRVK